MSKSKLLLSELIDEIHQINIESGWWEDLYTGQDLRTTFDQTPKRNVPEMLCLIHSEISEAMEGYRKNLMDDKLPHRKNMEVELADAFIRICDLSKGIGLDLEGAVLEKLEYNKTRADHYKENRKTENGKKF